MVARVGLGSGMTNEQLLQVWADLTEESKVQPIEKAKLAGLSAEEARLLWALRRLTEMRFEPSRFGPMMGPAPIFEDVSREP